MEKATIHRLVSDKNKELERATLRSAESIIEQITKEQGTVASAQKRIAELREQLKALEVKQINPAEILGES